MEKVFYTDYSKMFLGNHKLTKLYRDDYCELEMVCEEIDDATMKKIVDEIEDELIKEYGESGIVLLERFREGCEMVDGEVNLAKRIDEKERFLRAEIAEKYGMRKWEDIKEDEAAILKFDIEEYQRKH